MLITKSIIIKDKKLYQVTITHRKMTEWKFPRAVHNVLADSPEQAIKMVKKIRKDKNLKVTAHYNTTAVLLDVLQEVTS